MASRLDEDSLSAKPKAQASSKRGGSLLRLRKFCSFQLVMGRADPPTCDTPNQFWLPQREGIMRSLETSKVNKAAIGL